MPTEKRDSAELGTVRALCVLCAWLVALLCRCAAAVLNGAARLLHENPASAETPAPEYYLNIVVLNREETVRKHVGSTVHAEVAAATRGFGDVGAWAANAASNLAATLAAAAVSEGEVGQGVGGAVAQLLPLMLQQLSASATAEICFSEQNLCVLRCRIVDVDVGGLVERSMPLWSPIPRLADQSASNSCYSRIRVPYVGTVAGPPAATAWSRFLDVSAVFGAERAAERLGKERAIALISQQMVEQVPSGVVDAVAEQSGLRLEVTVRPEEAQAKSFFALHQVLRSCQFR